ncbi:protein senC [Gemmobacter lanyuensis]|uniref:Protein senC n=1 Tax=Gemmobacter lanyuensis TaxID=1054497 RepID=A0A918MIJ1_9RHOB|nr:SCO family protein [Gemmobacter lanyuensis]GGW25285.1 protein senC [Gemmobacter lanyuensis]
MSKLYAGLAIAAVVGMVGGLYGYSVLQGGNDPFAACRGGQIGGGAIGGPFTLVNGNGKTVTDAEVLTKPTILYFGYTFCPDVCPMDNARNADAVDLLESKGYDVQPVFISIDPERDTPEVMKDFAANLHPKMIGLTGSMEQVKAASLAYKTYFKKQESEDEFYLMDHSTFSYLTLPGIGFVDFFKRETTPEEMADRVACYVDAAKGLAKN